MRGHGLLHEGRPYDEHGRYTPGASTAYAFCACGIMSAIPLTSIAARRRWHRVHKTIVTRGDLA